MSLDIVNHHRSIYSILDFLGEIGGLFGILIYIGSIVASLPAFFFGDNANKYLVKSIFKQDKSRFPITKHDHTSESASKDDRKNSGDSKEIGIRTKPTLNLLCRRNLQERKATKLAANRIYKELDIVTFIRK